MSWDNSGTTNLVVCGAPPLHASTHFRDWSVSGLP